MADNPSVSVIVPIYNVEQYVKICVDSILAQTFQDFEIILVDDASPDGSGELCQKLYGDNDKVKLIRHEKNLGLGAARNTGIKNSRGKYVYFADSDDYVIPNALEKFFDAAEKSNAEVVHAAGYYELTQDEPFPLRKENLQFKPDRYSREGFLPPNPVYRIEKHWKTYDTPSMSWLCFCRRDFLEKNNLEFLPIISEDETFSFALFCLAEKYYILRKALYVYRKRAGSIMRTKNAEHFSKSIRTILLGSTYIKSFLNRFPRFENYEPWCESVMKNFFDRFVKSHTLPYYKDLSLSKESSDTVKNTLEKLFGNSAPFVKNFFNGYHFYRRQAEILSQQGQILFRQNQQLKNLSAMFIREQPAILELMNAIKSEEKKIFLMGTPNHGNLGDHAIVSGEIKILKEYFPDRKIVEIPSDYLSGEFGEILFGLGLEKYVRRTDIIAYHGGGNLGNLWIDEENIRRLVISKFPENKIIIFPQSIHFTADAEGRRGLAVSQKIYNSHKDLHLMTRDEVSFEFAKKFFPKVNLYLLPDAATVLQGITDDIDTEREGVLFILRGDKEKVRNDTKIRQLQNYLAEKNIPFDINDTVIKEKVTAEIREQKIHDVLIKIRRSKLVVTDRFHGVIFSFITRTPVLAFKSFDTKISAGIKWFKNFPSIFYAEDESLSGMKNFIDKYYFAVEEKISDALNVKADTDSREIFFRALNQIVAANKIYPPESSTSSLLSDSVDVATSRRLTIDAIKIFERRIVFDYRVQGDWAKVFNVDKKFFIEYSEDISRTPKDIAVIPFLCNVLPIAWIFDAEVVVDELDYDFYKHIAEIKQGYVDMYPRIKFGGKLTVRQLVRHDYEVGNETAAFFSGGADSFDTLIAHVDEHPTLITLLGSDIKLSDTKGRELVSKHAHETAKQFQCKSLFIASSFRLFLKEGTLSNLVMPLANDGWWHGFQHGIGIIGHVAPYAYLHKLKQIYIASSFSRKYKFTCASDPTIDNHVHIGKCVTIHDGFEFSRQDKIRRICEFKNRKGLPIHLRVCWQSSGGQNCCACEKCYRTICGILAEGENPADFDFPSYSLEQMRQDFQKPNFKYRPITWQEIRNRFRERPENLPKELDWLMEQNL